MKLKAPILAALGAVSAQFGGGPMEGRSIASLIDILPRDMLFGWYITMASRNEDLDDKTVMYLYAMLEKSKMPETPLPDNIFYAAMDYLSGISDRGLNCEGGTPCSVPLHLRVLHGYGCWCNLGAELGEGHGEPQDDYDTHCRFLQLCIRCAIADTKDDPGTCDPTTHGYQVSFTFDPITGALVGNCEDDNPGDDCGIALCMCEVDWIDNILGTGLSGIGLDTSLSHNSSITAEPFNDSLHCSQPTGLAGGPFGGGGADGPRGTNCCGAYPTRYAMSKDLECCVHDNSPFNPITHDCCDPAGVVDFGGCV